MFDGAVSSAADILQLLIDAGGDVNKSSWGCLPLHSALYNGRDDNVRVLLAQPSLELNVKYDNKSPEAYARSEGKSALADMVALEVSLGLSCRSNVSC